MDGTPAAQLRALWRCRTSAAEWNSLWHADMGPDVGDQGEGEGEERDAEEEAELQVRVGTAPPA